MRSVTEEATGAPGWKEVKAIAAEVKATPAQVMADMTGKVALVDLGTSVPDNTGSTLTVELDGVDL